MRSKPFLTLLALLAALHFTGCATGKKKGAVPEGKSWAVEPESFGDSESREYKRILDLYARAKYGSALSKLRKFVKKYKKSSKEPQVQNLFGLIYLQRQKHLSAIHRFNKALSASRSREFRQYVLYNLATAQYHSRRWTRSSQTLAKVDPDELNSSTRLKFHYLKGLVAYRLKQYPQSSEELLSASVLFNSIPADSAQILKTRDLYEKQLKASLAKIKDPAILENLVQSYPESPMLGEILYRLGTRAFKAGQVGRAEKYLRRFLTDYPGSPHYGEVVEALRGIQTEKVADPSRVGVLLPMTGRFAQFGKQSLRGIELAFRIYNLNKPDSKVTLVIEDSGDTPEKSVEALNRLYYDHKVVAVIGPLLSKGIEEVTKRAQDLGVPMISLAQKSGTPGDYVFECAVTAKHQARAIAQYAIEKRGFKRFAIVFPKDKFGQEYSKHFWDALDEMGASVVGVEEYSPKETDFRQVVDRLAGLHYPQARKRELEELRKARERDNITKKTRKTEHYYKLPPIVDFDAVFIPDEAKAVGQLLPTFAYRDIENVTFLGVATWNSPLLLRRAKGHAENSVFVDTFFAQGRDPEIRIFVNNYENIFGKLPSAIEALSYDAASLLERAILLSSSFGAKVSRSDLRDRLMNVANFAGVTGRISYEEGRFNRRLRLLTIRNQRIQEAPNAPPPRLIQDPVLQERS